MLRLSELYMSVQGEGPNVGKPTTFVRFAGCNYTCPGWPCDTQWAIDPKIYRKEQVSKSPEELVEDVERLVPSHVCITGGEPLIQSRKNLDDFAWELLHKRYSIDLFTNGSQLLPSWAFATMSTVIMDWKLPSSGEGEKDLDVRKQNRHALMQKDAVKLVVKDYDDLKYASELLDSWGVPVHQVYFGRVWDAELQDSNIVDYILENHLYYVKLNIQTHKMIWPAEARRT